MRWSEDQLAQHLERRGIPGAANTADTSNPPFALPSDIVIDLPVPPSVNQTRRYDFSHSKIVQRWKDKADPLIFAAKTSALNPLKLSRLDRFEIAIIISEDHTQMDLDNGIKCLIDYLKKIGVIKDDAPKNLRALIVMWGKAVDAPEGCRVTVRACA